MHALSKLFGTALSLSLIAAPVVAAHQDRQDSPAPNSSAAFSFGLIADPQYWDGPASGTRYYADSTQKLAEAVETINQSNVDFTVQVGDLIDRDSASFDKILPILNQIKGPRYNLLGNHDFPSGLSSEKAVSLLDMPNEYYDVTYQKWRFIMLDNNDISLYANEPGSADYKEAERILEGLRNEGADNAQTWNGALGEEQMTWLNETLADADEKGQKAIVFGHMPVEGGHTENAWDAPAIQEALESHNNLVAYINGHYHAGAYQVVNGIHYVTLKGMVEQAYPANAYSVVTVQENKARIDGYGRQPDLVLDVPAGAR